MRNRLPQKLIFFRPFLLAAMISLSACNYNKNRGADEAPLDEAELNTMALENNYLSVQNKVLASQCLGCHSAGSGNKGGLNLETYANIKMNLNQILYRVTETRDMPAGGLQGYPFELMKMWLESGAPEQNTSDGAGAPITGPLNWSKIKTQILVKNCLDCHQGTHAEAGLDLDNLENFKKNYPAIFDRVFVKQDMPPEPFDALTTNEKNALLKWISQGFQQ